MTRWIRDLELNRWTPLQVAWMSVIPVVVAMVIEPNEVTPSVSNRSMMRFSLASSRMRARRVLAALRFTSPVPLAVLLMFTAAAAAPVPLPPAVTVVPAVIVVVAERVSAETGPPAAVPGRGRQ